MFEQDVLVVLLNVFERNTTVVKTVGIKLNTAYNMFGKVLVKFGDDCLSSASSSSSSPSSILWFLEYTFIFSFIYHSSIVYYSLHDQQNCMHFFVSFLLEAGGQNNQIPISLRGLVIQTVYGTWYLSKTH